MHGRKGIGMEALYFLVLESRTKTSIYSEILLYCMGSLSEKRLTSAYLALLFAVETIIKIR